MAKKTVKEKIVDEEILKDEIDVDLNDDSCKVCDKDICESDEPLTNDEEMKAELERLQNYTLRMKADIENMKKRNQNLATEMYKDGKMETLCAVLPVADSLDRALALDMEENVKEGIDKIKKQFESIIEKLGIVEINAVGEQFNPNLHNALMQVEDAENSGKCVQVYEKGYKLGDKVLRHASVVVAK